MGPSLPEENSAFFTFHTVFLVRGGTQLESTTVIVKFPRSKLVNGKSGETGSQKTNSKKTKKTDGCVTGSSSIPILNTT